MSERLEPSESYGVHLAGDDAVVPFQVDALDLRGRTVQMGPAIDAMLARHDYPPAVSKLLAEAIVLTVLLGSSLKFEGQFLLQTQTDGPVDMLVVDFRTPGDLRAYARFDKARVAAMAAGADPSALLGTGILAMTIDQGPHTSRYQGIVALEGGTLEDVAHAYFAQSEQIPTLVRLAVAELYTRGETGAARHGWRAGGLLVQFLPDAPERIAHRDISGGDAPEGVEMPGGDEDDAWVEAQSLVGTIEDHELIDPDVPVERLLYRLFHERGVRVYDPTPVRDQCSCSRERIAGVLRSFTAEEIEESIEDGAITVTCEFCGTRYGFDPAEFRAAG
ncbi:Hsp33 family molecular chaperone [Prosthecomicrobium pneumaticum]|uniref:Molecular chaperone Hsp33 n=1 Tax=Prosthecomicrobium pneumaticum TaxID=81895 RepID=A0A7W9FMF6_9HYPH|nr:Hsp33 family molecular chaperone [Prosthecomicrobium pneumaticum]MBB5753343.1 molecular chaperone Hsp33 [Prosthecomicrobium pneumaticum]